MRTMIITAATVLALSAGVANAESEGGPVANTQFTSNPSYLAQAPVQNVPPTATAQNGRSISVYGTKSVHGTWLFAPRDGGGANS